MKLIELTRGLQAKVDDEDYPALSQYLWYASGDRTGPRFYAARRFYDGKYVHFVYMHRLFHEDAYEVDHINGDTLDNQKHNLRPALRTENAWNASLSLANTTGYKGVSPCKTGPKPYRSRIKINGEEIHIGTFNDPILAALAYDQHAYYYQGEFASPNFPCQEHRDLWTNKEAV